MRKVAIRRGDDRHGRLLLLSFVVGTLLLMCINSTGVLAQGEWLEITINGNKPQPRLYAASSNNAPLPPPYNPEERTGLVIFGGTNDTSYEGAFFNDVWILNVQDQHNDDRVWTLIEIDHSSDVPAPRCLSAIAVETETMTMYMYGGFNGTDWFSDFWSLDLSAVQYPGTSVSWVFIGSDMGPPQMCGMSLVYCPIYTDLSRWSLLMFGGGYGKRQLYNTLWSYDFQSTSWFKFAPSVGEPPSPREFFGAYCLLNGRMVVFGGNDYDYDSYNDTHALISGSSSASTIWDRLGEPNNTPAARGSFAGTALHDNYTIIIYGGRDTEYVYNDLWVFTKDMYWESITTASYGPNARFGSASGLSNVKGTSGLLVIGGADNVGNVYNDVWIFNQASTTSTSGGQSTGQTAGGPSTAGQTAGQSTGGQTSGGGPVTTAGGGPSTSGQTYSTGGQTTAGVSTRGQTAGGYSTGGQTGGESTGGQIHKGGSRV
eukprot:TRINITY_DN1148_c0_g1_i6.p1 TRINITY_DN1148_c0_g1~~TRINITY_DN1148_c0_g1_i6.p1  ORF type:complete len:485 (-),score=60.66 TRINITY_DN1148_c0_g1_i6:102-1556(-)